METTRISDGISVKVVHLNNLPQGVQSRINKVYLQTRRVKAQGIVIRASMPGLKTEAFLVQHRDDFGEPCGETAIYFPGEVERIPDITIGC